MKVAVVGAGIVGLLTAYELRKRGHDVKMVSTGIADDATYAAAGMLAPAAEVQAGQDALWPLMMQAAKTHRELAKELGDDAGYRTTATIVVARDQADLEELRRLAEIQKRAGMDVADLTPREARRAEPALTRGIAGAVRIETDHQVDPRRLSAALETKLKHDGVEMRHETVQNTDDVDADRVVLAAGLGVDNIDGPHKRLDLQLRPVHGDILRLQTPPQALAPGEDNLIASTVRALVRGRAVYVVPRADRGLVLGATSREDDLAGVSTGGVHQLLQDAIEIIPALRETELVEVTARARPGTPDDLPLLGAVDDHVILSTGYHRHGILLSAWAATLTANMIDGVGEPPDAVAADRFTTVEEPTEEHETSTRQ